MMSDVDKYDNEYDKTKEGIKNKKRFKTYSSYEDMDYKDVFYAEKEYLQSQAKYTAEKMLKKYGSEKLSVYLNRGASDYYKIGKNIVDDYIENEWVRKAQYDYGY